MTPLRIAYLAYRGNPHSGGQGVYTRHLTRELVELGHEVTVFGGQPWPVLDEGVGWVPVPSLDLYREPDPFRVPRPREFRSLVDVAEFGLMCTAGFPEPWSFSMRARRVLREARGRFDKVHRVPFGEYVPGRWLIRHFVSLGVIPRDAIPGHGTGTLATAAGPVGIVISFEVFFPERARSAIRGGGQVLLVPTNTASYTTTQVPAAELAADRIRAWETGRDVAMVAPTGWSAVVDSRGHVLQRTRLVVQTVLEATLPRRTGRTPYVSWGDLPALIVAAALLGAGWGVSRLPRPS